MVLVTICVHTPTISCHANDDTIDQWRDSVGIVMGAGDLTRLAALAALVQMAVGVMGEVIMSLA